ncbi:MAG: DUF5320 domain-containing protein [Chloroflexi bacterium]|nr:DUF5320 domain-containing protein [Chloroflexota bacterium]
MPRFDGTGPTGQGPLTGRGEGYCAVPLPNDAPSLAAVARWGRGVWSALARPGFVGRAGRGVARGARPSMGLGMRRSGRQGRCGRRGRW